MSLPLCRALVIASSSSLPCPFVFDINANWDTSGKLVKRCTGNRRNNWAKTNSAGWLGESGGSTTWRGHLEDQYGDSGRGRERKLSDGTVAGRKEGIRISVDHGRGVHKQHPKRSTRTLRLHPDQVRNRVRKWGCLFSFMGISASKRESPNLKNLIKTTLDVGYSAGRECWKKAHDSADT